MSNKIIQMNIPILEETREQLKRIARQRSIEKDYDVTYGDLVREAIEKLIAVSGSVK
jgi:hypothetical protein